MVLGRDPEFPGDDMLCPLTEPNVVSNSTIIEDEMARFSQQARLEARKAVIMEMDQQTARTALNSRPRPHRSFKPGDEVAVWRRGRGIPGKRSHARWRGPGVVASANGSHYWVSMPGAMIKCSVEQLRFRTVEEQEADKFLVRDLRAAAVNLYPEVGGENRRQKCFLDITEEDVPPSTLLGPEPNNQPVPEATGNQPATNGTTTTSSSSSTSNNQTAGEHSAMSPKSGDAGQPISVPSSGSVQSRGEQLAQLSPEQLQQLPPSVEQANRLDDHHQHTIRPWLHPNLQEQGNHPQPEQRLPEPKRPRTDGQQVGGQHYPPAMPKPPANASGNAQYVSDSAECNVALSELDSDESMFFLVAADNEVLLAGGRREINPRSGEWMTPDKQTMISKGMAKELKTVIQDKLALRPLEATETEQVLRDCPDRILDSRVVLTEKHDDEGNSVVKARWTARGDRDPDLFQLIRDGRTAAPTISSNGRYTVLQTIASQGLPYNLVM